MTVSAATLELLVKAGLQGEALLEVVRSIEADTMPKPRSSNAERQARFRARKKEQAAAPVTEPVTSNVTSDVTDDAKGFDKERSPRPSKEITSKIQTQGEREPAPALIIEPLSEPVARETPQGRHRLPEGWRPRPAVWQLAKNLGFTDAEIDDQLQRFHDWAVNADNSKGRKSDWNAAFRNWMKGKADDRKKREQRSGSYQRRPSEADRMREAFDGLREELAGVGQIVRRGEFDGP